MVTSSIYGYHMLTCMLHVCATDAQLHSQWLPPLLLWGLSAETGHSGTLKGLSLDGQLPFSDLVSCRVLVLVVCYMWQSPQSHRPKDWLQACKYTLHDCCLLHAQCISVRQWTAACKATILVMWPAEANLTFSMTQWYWGSLSFFPESVTRRDAGLWAYRASISSSSISKSLSAVPVLDETRWLARSGVIWTMQQQHTVETLIQVISSV